MSRILIVEDDRKIAQLEQLYLEMSGYETNIVADGSKVEEETDQNRYDLILLDLMLPKTDGMTICQNIREKTDIPILMVTAKTESLDVIRGLGLGADDYITKPFDPAQLVARVKAHLARYERLKGNSGGEEKKKDRKVIEIGDITLIPENWKVYRRGAEIKLPGREFELLLFLAENPNIVFSREQLFERIWGCNYESDAATVSVHINRLREKLEENPRNPRMIETIWGVGYRLNL
ncbi:MAG: response regulator transcription factor [Roseburia sp.]|nr:response regulator transcription factor [Roseburia sp.]